MPTWMLLAKGPAFLFVLTVLLLGLLRLILLTTWDIIAAVRRAGDRRLPYRQIALQTLLWLLPFNKLHRNRAGYSLASFGLHLSLFVVALFSAQSPGHLASQPWIFMDGDLEADPGPVNAGRDLGD